MNKKLLVLFILLFVFSSLLVKADNIYYLTSDGVRFRRLPTTKNSDILDTLYTGDKVNVLDTKTISGEGCDDGWFKVKIGEVEGYICSKYLTTTNPKTTSTYDRPWNTPKKAIIGGAKYIANAYISKGQFTSYLKKFNVNPFSTAQVFNHQYQTSLFAPSTEAAKSSNAYINAGNMNLPFTFTIPVYENMKDSYPNPAGISANLGTTTDTDDKFEEMIKDFPDSYKPYLRQLHKEHNNWIFKALKTNLDFEYAARVEQTSGAVQGNRLYYELNASGNPTQAGNDVGWYIPNLATTMYYLDPRNFLNESYVFMFEDLSFNDSIGEATIKSVLSKKSIMPEYDVIDNQSYASIFLEAGRVANVNPVYLASLSMTEIGKSNISGEEFVYNGITYSGLYNFYNLGAASSASNPLRAGLVFASGGACTICANVAGEIAKPKEETKPSKETDEKQESKIDNTKVYGNLSNIGVNSYGNYVNGFTLGERITNLLNKDKNITYNSTDIIKTGTILDLGNGSKYTAVIFGDLSGDGKINSADLLRLRQHLLGTNGLSGAYLEAAKVTGNNNVNSANLLRLRQHLLGTNIISQK